MEELTVTVKDDGEKHCPQRYRLMYPIAPVKKIIIHNINLVDVWNFPLLTARIYITRCISASEDCLILANCANLNEMRPSWSSLFAKVPAY